MEDIVNPLNIYVIWHPSFKEGADYAESFFSHYNHDVHDPLSRGIGIPVYYRTGKKPVNIDLSKSQYNAVVILVDDKMVISEEWSTYIDEINEKINKTNERNIILPIAVSENAFKISNKLPSKNFIRLYDATSSKVEFLLNKTTHEICRLLYDVDRIDHETSTTEPKSSPPLKLFISHAKEDGVDVAKQLSDYIQTQTTLTTFFDANDIAIGYGVSEEIEDNIQKSVLLVIQSDKYSSREWCRREVLIAKRNNRPIVVVNLYDEGEERSFPYMGNLKIIRFNKTPNKEEKMFEKILLLTLQETLRFKYHQMFISYLTEKFDINEVAILSQPPELLTLLKLVDKGDKLTIYPDPPLSKDELALVNRGAMNNMQFLTPTYIPLLRNKDEYGIHELSFLDDINVGISISEIQNINEYGFEHTHLQDALVEFARYLLASGASLSYGGDVRYDPKFNFAQILFDLARSYQKENIKPPDKITNFVSYPIYTKISSEEQADLNDIAKFINVPPPDNLEGDHSKIMKAETPDDLYVWARSLSEMREKMNSYIDARIILGGKTTCYKGKIPGIVEEAYLALKSNKPVYLIGSMGGASKAVIDCLMGKETEELTKEYQFRNDKYKSLYIKYNELAVQDGREPINYQKLVAFFNEVGIAGLNNGLSDEENIKLFNTVNTTEMISLVLKGLLSIQNGENS